MPRPGLPSPRRWRSRPGTGLPRAVLPVRRIPTTTLSAYLVVGDQVTGIESLGSAGPDPDATVVFQASYDNRWVANTYLFPATLPRYEWQDIVPMLTGNQWKTTGTTWLPFDTAGTWT